MSVLRLTPLLLCAACASSSEDEAIEPATEASPRRLLTDEELAAYGLPYEFVEGEPMFTLLQPDDIPAIDAPEFASAAEARAWMQPDEPVLGVVGANGTAKCYSAWQLDSHEIVNDQLDGAAIAATW